RARPEEDLGVHPVAELADRPRLERREGEPREVHLPEEREREREEDDVGVDVAGGGAGLEREPVAFAARADGHEALAELDLPVERLGEGVHDALVPALDLVALVALAEDLEPLAEVGPDEEDEVEGRLLAGRSEEHTSELQSLENLVCRL